MKYIARKLKSPRYGKRWRLKGIHMDFCCPRMKEASDQAWVYPSSDGCELAVTFSEGYDDITEVLGIRFCPFCGEKIELDVK